MGCWEGKKRGLWLRGWSGEVGHCDLVDSIIVGDLVVIVYMFVCKFIGVGMSPGGK